MGRLVVIAAVLVSLTACEKKKNEGLPPAQEWGGNPGDMPPVQQQGKPANPHAGMAMGGADPHAGVDMNNPHAGIDMSNPHGGEGGGVDVEKMGLPAPDPSRPIDDALFVGNWGGTDDLPFEMTEKQAMIAGTELTGDVVVTARYDQDGDALSKQSGDITGSIKVKIPADNVTLTLDEVLP